MVNLSIRDGLLVSVARFSAELAAATMLVGQEFVIWHPLVQSDRNRLLIPHTDSAPDGTSDTAVTVDGVIISAKIRRA